MIQMNAFIDYYAVLGVTTDATPGAIKAAFKKLALQYHPDVYKGADAHERMRLILLAYQTLSDPQERKAYDNRHAEHVAGNTHSYVHTAPPKTSSGKAGMVSPKARRDRYRHYDFPDLRSGQAAQIDLVDVSYSLSPVGVDALLKQGLLRGVMQSPQRNELRPNAPYEYYCHRCHHHWPPRSTSSRDQAGERFCPKCHADDWAEYLLLRCIHCCAVFESEQIRYEVGSYNYGDGSLCPPYELFPLCPYCGSSGWCPAEDARVDTLRAEAAKRAARMRLIWISVAVVVVALVAVMMTTIR